MTEENTVVAEQPQEGGQNISVEQILAAIIHTVGDINVKLEDLVANYGDKTISVNQQEDKSVTFSLVELASIQTPETAE